MKPRLLLSYETAPFSQDLRDGATQTKFPGVFNALKFSQAPTLVPEDFVAMGGWPTSLGKHNASRLFYQEKRL